MSSFRVLINFISKRYAGHSKWANIKHIKGVKDAQRSALFTKLSRQMKVAIAEGGSTNPDNNLKLYQVIEQAKRNSMPVATIQNVIKSTQTKKDNAKSGLLEIRGPSGSIILCEIFTENLTRLKQNVAAILKKGTACQIADGSGRRQFDQKGIIQVENPHGSLPEEELLELAMEHAIESGAEDVKLLSDNQVIQFICDPKSLRDVQSKIEELKYKITSSEVEYIPTLLITTLSDKELDILSNVCDKLETQEEIIKMYDNIG